MGRVDALFGWVRADPPEYVCRDCETGFERRRHVCPACGGFRVGRRRPEP